MQQENVVAVSEMQWSICMCVTVFSAHASKLIRNQLATLQNLSA